MPDKKLAEELLNELLDAPNIDGYIREHDLPPRRFRTT